jgi:predicted ATPase
MSQHPFLKSIRPVNLLSFGPNTEEIELRPLNILIGPNGSGKSNLIEVIGLLSRLPEKDPWSKVRETGGAKEWVWKGEDAENGPASLSVNAAVQEFSTSQMLAPDYLGCRSLFYMVQLSEGGGTFGVTKERFVEIGEGEDGMLANQEAFDREEGEISSRRVSSERIWAQPDLKLPSNRSILSMIGSAPGLTLDQPHMSGLADALERFAFYRDWVFGAGFTARSPVSAGQPVERLQEDASNLAQLLARYQSDFRAAFDVINELMKKFYEPIKSVEVRIVSTHLQVAILEEGGFSIPAYRLSDGTLRWLALLTILLNPTPGPVTCIEEPELGLHPDMISTLADLLRDASTRTQLILTTHSQSLVSEFSDDPESVCVCEKIDGATKIRRLDKERLSVWLEDYSLGHLWASGEIGGNRW